MVKAIISKVLEIDGCDVEEVAPALFQPPLWEKISPVSEITVKFSAPNVMYSEFTENVGGVIKIPIEMTGELVLMDKGEEPGKGQLIEFNVRNNHDVRKLEGNIRMKQIAPNKAKIGVFIHALELESNFMNLIGKNASEFILRTKITQMLRNLEKLCKDGGIKDLQ